MTAFLIISVHALTAKSETKSVIYTHRRDNKHTWFLHMVVPPPLSLRADLEELKKEWMGEDKLGAKRR